MLVDNLKSRIQIGG